MRLSNSLAVRGLTTHSDSFRRVRFRRPLAIAMAILTLATARAPLAVADSADSLRAAVMAIRSASCGPLQPDPLVEQATQDLNGSIDAWLNQEGRKPPEDDPLPILTDSGYGGSKAVLLRGAGRTDADAIKGLLLESYLDIPNCAYAKYGVSVLRNRTTNYFLAALVLAV
jgi:hypothetical protein